MFQHVFQLWEDSCELGSPRLRPGPGGGSDRARSDGEGGLSSSQVHTPRGRRGRGEGRGGEERREGENHQPTSFLRDESFST